MFLKPFVSLRITAIPLVIIPLSFNLSNTASSSAGKPNFNSVINTLHISKTDSIEICNNLSHVRKHASGMIESTGTMECILENSKIADNNKIYGIGDAICTINQKTGQIIPQVARAALSRATIASHNIIERIKYTEGLTTRPNIKTYIPAGEYPYVIPVGGKWAVAKLGPIIISGFFGWVLKGLVEINYLLSIMPKWKAFKLWIKGLRIFIQNEQLG